MFPSIKDINHALHEELNAYFSLPRHEYNDS